ncbi:MAG: glycine--tRNA ligase, partial [Pseudomonadota bacterium]|nr:glycine--tRNA ligase [Pseudomonadota bacterium]
MTMAAQKTETEPQAGNKDMKEIVALCKRRGFIFPASEIYGGFNGFWDYGPLGAELKNNIRDLWWKAMVTTPPLGPDGQPLQIVGLDSSIIQNPKLWEASGHTTSFSDPMVDCRETKKRYRADHLVIYKDKGGALPWVAVFEGDEADADAAKRMKKVAKNISVENCDVSVLTELEVSDFEKIIGPDAKEVGT